MLCAITSISETFPIKIVVARDVTAWDISCWSCNMGGQFFIYTYLMVTCLLHGMDQWQSSIVVFPA